MGALLVALLAPFVVVFAIAIGILLNLVLAYPLMWAWNYVVPGLFASMHPLDYWQAFSLLVVASLLVKSSASSSSK